MHIVKYHYQVWMNQVKYCRCDSLVWSQGSIVWLPGRRLHFWEDFFWKLTENFIKSYLHLKPWSTTCSSWPLWQHVSTWEYNRPDPCQDEARRSDWALSWLEFTLSRYKVFKDSIYFTHYPIHCNASFLLTGVKMSGQDLYDKTDKYVFFSTHPCDSYCHLNAKELFMTFLINHTFRKIICLARLWFINVLNYNLHAVCYVALSQWNDWGVWQLCRCRYTRENAISVHLFTLHHWDAPLLLISVSHEKTLFSLSYSSKQ